MKKAIITGITGQDGSYLAELLLSKGYEVHGFIRRVSEPNYSKIESILPLIELHQVEMTDFAGIARAVAEVRPDEIYNLAAMSQVAWSFKNPINTFDVNCVGLLRLLEAVRLVGGGYNPRIYQAGSSEMFGKVQEIPQNEDTKFYPRSPYGVSKSSAFYLGRQYREAYSMNIYNGMLFNHESPRRGIEFLSRKVSHGVAQIHFGKQEFLVVGNLEAKRDFGYAKDYVEWIYKIVQGEPDDYVIATGEQHSIREWVELAFDQIDLPIHWVGLGVNEIGLDELGVVRVKIDPSFYRPNEVDTLLGDASKSKRLLGFEANTKFKELVKLMLDHEISQR